MALIKCILDNDCLLFHTWWTVQRFVAYGGGAFYWECKIPNIAVIFFLQNLVHFFIRTISGDLFWEVARALSHCIFLIDRQIYKKNGLSPWGFGVLRSECVKLHPNYSRIQTRSGFTSLILNEMEAFLKFRTNHIPIYEPYTGYGGFKVAGSAPPPFK